MNASSHFEKHPDVWIKIWMGIGLLGFLFLLFFVNFAERTFSAEEQRFIACSKRQRTDCSPSVYWMMNDWELPE